MHPRVPLSVSFFPFAHSRRRHSSVNPAHCAIDVEDLTSGQRTKRAEVALDPDEMEAAELEVECGTLRCWPGRCRRRGPARTRTSRAQGAWRRPGPRPLPYSTGCGLVDRFGDQQTTRRSPSTAAVCCARSLTWMKRAAGPGPARKVIIETSATPRYTVPKAATPRPRRSRPVRVAWQRPSMGLTLPGVRFLVTLPFYRVARNSSTRQIVPVGRLSRIRGLRGVRGASRCQALSLVFDRDSWVEHDSYFRRESRDTQSPHAGRTQSYR